MARVGVARILALCPVLLCGCFESYARDDAGEASDESEASSDGPDDGYYCHLPTAITFGYEGGYTSYDVSYELRSDRTFVATRIERDAAGTTTTCSTQIPPCGAGAGVPIWYVAFSLDDGDVRAALSLPVPPLYGYDPRPVDGSVFAVRRPDGRGFLSGEECASHSPCTPIPLGISSLVAVLRNLIEQELAKPECADLLR